MPLSADRSRVLDAMPDAVYLIDPDTSRIVDCNVAAHAELGMNRSEILNHSVLSLQKDVKGLPQWSEIAGVIRVQGDYTFIGRHAHVDGSEIPVEVNTRCVHIDGREWFISVARNISRRVLFQCELAERNKRVEAWRVLYEVADGVWDWKVSDGSLHFSPGLKQMLGYGPDEMKPVLATWEDSVHPEDKPLVMRILGEHLAGRRARYEAMYRLRNRNGHYLWVHDRGRVVEWNESGESERVVGMLQDITDMKSLEAELQRHATRDALTGLFNRRRGEELLQQSLLLMKRMESPLALCLLDLDHFKQVNDLYGHLVGDSVLEQVSALLREAIRETDLLFRWGGEELVLALPNTDLPSAIGMLDQLRNQLAGMRIESDGVSLQITASLGLAMYPDDGRNLTELIGQADSALYAAKLGGRNCLRWIGRPDAAAPIAV